MGLKDRIKNNPKLRTAILFSGLGLANLALGGLVYSSFSTPEVELEVEREHEEVN